MAPKTRRSSLAPIKESPKKKNQLAKAITKKLSVKDVVHIVNSDDESDHKTSKSVNCGKSFNNYNDMIVNGEGIRMKFRLTDEKEYEVIFNSGKEEKPSVLQRPRRSMPVRSLNEDKLIELNESQALLKKSRRSEVIKQTKQNTHEVVLSESEDDENKMVKANTNNGTRSKKNKSSSNDLLNVTPRKKTKKSDMQLCDSPLKNLTDKFERNVNLQTPTGNSAIKASKKKLSKSFHTPSKDLVENFENFHVQTPKRNPRRSCVRNLNTTPDSVETKLRSTPRVDYKIINDSTEDYFDGDDEDKDADFIGSEKEDDSDTSEEVSESSDEIDSGASEDESPAYKNKKYQATKTHINTPRSVKKLISTLTPSMQKRIKKIAKPSTPLQEARIKLHVSILPKSLPCREEQFNDIYTFLHGRLSDCTGGCIYISGVPGTGKTATVNEVIRCLTKAKISKKLPEFNFVDINGMKLSEPRQAYVQIWKQLTGESKTWEEAQKLLQSRFTKSNSKHMTLLLVDELDLLCTKRQDVVYNLLDWPSKANANLVVVTIANTMDLPERILIGRVSSRLGLTRLTFPTYTFQQLEEIVLSRLKGFDDAFSGETIQLVARKVAAVSGDARRALDICRRATEIAEINKREKVTMADIQQALNEMIASPKIQAIKYCSDMEKYFLKAVCAEVTRKGIEEVILKNVYFQMGLLLGIERIKMLNISEVLDICARLGSYRLLICEHSRRDIHQRLFLNVATDDVQFAIQNA